jgi:hypothetical protein
LIVVLDLKSFRVLRIYSLVYGSIFKLRNSNYVSSNNTFRQSLVNIKGSCSNFPCPPPATAGRAASVVAVAAEAPHVMANDSTDQRPRGGYAKAKTHVGYAIGATVIVDCLSLVGAFNLSEFTFPAANIIFSTALGVIGVLNGTVALGSPAYLAYNFVQDRREANPARVTHNV